MKTDDLIRLLAADLRAPRPDLRARLLLGALIGAVCSTGLVLLFLGLRPDLAEALANWRLAVKFAVALSFAVTGAVLGLNLARPFASGPAAWLILLPGPLILLAACLYELTVMPSDLWMRRAIGVNALPCLIAIPLFSALPLVGIMWALRDGAPASPSQAGAAAGAMAAGIGAALYALHCPDDSPLFLLIWYALAAAVVIVAGRASGARLLRW